MKSLFSLAACALATSLLLMPTAYAQFGGAGGGGMPGSGGARHGGASKGCEREAGKEGSKEAGPAGAGAPDMVSADQLNYQLNALQVDMRLTQEQATAWSAFASQVRALQADAARERSRGVSAVGATPTGSGSMQAIRASVDRSRNRMTALEDLEMSAKALYDLLQVDQKAQADLRLMPFLAPLLRG
ncbi:MAG: hypothetical protein CFE43_03670 [Burkholderiales bacterium PBB3]|nr:MAG: hypothetical protein CFE43_03670 [Burkholderiales bacterium PBB3]